MKLGRVGRSAGLLFGVVLTGGVLLGANHLSRHRPLTTTELKCVGSWCFRMPETPSTLQVYHFADNGRVLEEHYYLTSATPTIPRLKMHGVWQVEQDGRLIVERARGVNGAILEVTRQARNLAGQEQYDFGILRRFYKVRRVEPGRLTVQDNLMVAPGQYELVELVMLPFDGVPR
jgi:hypothetical protein